jgi:hypothetical protein
MDGYMEHSVHQIDRRWRVGSPKMDLAPFCWDVVCTDRVVECNVVTECLGCVILLVQVISVLTPTPALEYLTPIGKRT